MSLCKFAIPSIELPSLTLGLPAIPAFSFSYNLPGFSFNIPSIELPSLSLGLPTLLIPVVVLVLDIPALPAIPILSLPTFTVGLPAIPVFELPTVSCPLD